MWGVCVFGGRGVGRVRPSCAEGTSLFALFVGLQYSDLRSPITCYGLSKRIANLSVTR